MELPRIWFALPTGTICKSVSGFVTECPCGVCCHGLATCLCILVHYFMTSSNEDIFRVTVPCLTTAIWRCRKPFTQWQRSFLWKLPLAKILATASCCSSKTGPWPFTRGIHRSPVNAPHKGQWRGALMFSMICALNKRLSKHSWSWWFDMPTRSLWRHCIVAKLFWVRLLIWSKGNTFGHVYVFLRMLIFISTQVI